MLTHDQIWTAIDRLAERYGLSASGLARRAGLDATSFNKSKRVSPDGRRRWPSTESVAKILDATGASLAEFLSLIAPMADAAKPVTIPLLSLGDVGAAERFDPEGMPVGPAGDEIEFPGDRDEKVFAVEVTAAGALYREGDILVVSPTAETRRGDRIVVRLSDGSVEIRELKRRTARSLDLAAPGAADRTVASADVAWIGRVMWVRQ